MDNILFIPGIANPVSEIRQLLFGAGQPGGSWIPTLSSAMIAANSFGSGVTDILDLSGNNNPFSQATPSSRGAWFREPKRGRVNLLLQTEALTTTPWSTTVDGTGVVPIITPAQLAPDGSLTAFRVQLNCGGGTTSNDRSGLTQSLSGLPLSITSTQVYVKPLDGTTGAQLAALGNFSIIAAGANPQVNNTATAQPDGWFLLTRNLTTQSSTGTYRFQLLGNQQQTLDVLVWHPQAEVGATPTAYQRVTTAFDVTEAGQRDCFGVQGDGIDDGYQRAIDFSGTEQMTVFAAVRKLSDAADSSIVEHTVGGLNGWFGIYAPGSSGVARFQYNTRGTSGSFPFTSSTAFNAPITAIVTGQSRISTDLATLRINGTQVASSASDQGSGNYANATLNLFRREAGTMPFNGNLYALIVAGGSYPLSTIQRVERILSRITPTVNL